jgi:2'-5' RNA ligase
MANRPAQDALLAHQLEWTWPANARLVAPERMHLTLLFLGNVEEADELRLRNALRVVTMEPLYLLLRGAEVFDGGAAVLMAEEKRALGLLQGDIAAVVQGLGLSVDRKPWRPHLTLARDASGCQPPAEAPAIEFDALQFSLVCSRPERASSYEVVESWPA